MTTISMPLHDALAAALAWLYETEQPAGAIKDHSDLLFLVDGTRTLTPLVHEQQEEDSASAALPALRLDVAGEGGEDTVTDRDLADLAEAVRAAGYPVSGTWRSAPVGRHRFSGGYVGLLRPAHPTLIAAADLFDAGCPAHGSSSMRCGDFWGADDEERACRWYADGRALLVEPELLLGGSR